MSKFHPRESIFQVDNIRKLSYFFENACDQNARKFSAEIASLYKENIERLNLFFKELEEKNQVEIAKCLEKLNCETRYKIDDLMDSASDERSSDTELVKNMLQTSMRLSPDEWTVGSIVEARDRSKNGYEWYKSKIVEIEAKRCKIHYYNWHPRHDRWYNLDSSELRSFREETETLKKSKFQKGDKVLARNPTDSTDREKFHPAVIDELKFDNDVLYYQVLFYETEFLKYLIKIDDIKDLNEQEPSLAKITKPKSNKRTESGLNYLSLPIKRKRTISSKDSDNDEGEGSSIESIKSLLNNGQ